MAKKIPYGKSNFCEVRSGDYYFVDKTKYLPILEETDYIFMVRPRRFGKSLFLSMMQAYYDTCMAGRFDELFSGTWIHEHPTDERGKYIVLYFDFSLASAGMGGLEEKFNRYLDLTLDMAIKKYSFLLDKEDVADGLSRVGAAEKLIWFKDISTRKGFKLYLIIDEYDNFTNNVLAVDGTEAYNAMTHGTGFYREYFKIFKAMFSRIFLMGVSPVTLDDLTSGYNIDWGLADKPSVNTMLGFSESDLREMLNYYKNEGSIDCDVEQTIGEMKPLYDNYCFAPRAVGKETVYNCASVLFYLKNLIDEGCPPEDPIDKNISMDFSKLDQISRISAMNSRGGSQENVINQIIMEREVPARLKRSFPADHIADQENLLSLMYYYGLLTLKSYDEGLLMMGIPNQCVEEQFYGYFIRQTEKYAQINMGSYELDLHKAAYKGDWRPMIDYIAGIYKQASSVRDTTMGEKDVQGFFKAFLWFSRYYRALPESELAHGFADFFLLPRLREFPTIKHSYIVELKYVGKNATRADIDEKLNEGRAQLDNYASSDVVKMQSAGTSLHKILLCIQGWEVAYLEEE